MVAPTTARQQFDRQATYYNERWAGWSDEALRVMLALADPEAGWRVLDVATGTGFTALAFAPHVAHVTGADISPGMLREAQKRAEAGNIANVVWVESPAEALPFADGSFDLVTVRIAPHHFDDVDAFLRESRRVLVPNGVFLLCDTTVPADAPDAADWQNRVERERDGSHHANLSPDVWQAKCAQAGFTVTDCLTGGGGVALSLTPWLETAGCVGEAAARVRALFADAPPSARDAFQITTDPTGETHFVWQRVVVRAVPTP